ncbi:protein of unknown function [Bacillus velezensis UCMB5033]|nr:protein of unknown function [Bacillus velezensis UCMB5113]CDG29637.1 protein of unknown function [Bacillus velezensis UCMB5033]
MTYRRLHQTQDAALSPQILSINNFYMKEKQLDVKQIIFMIYGIQMQQLYQKLKNSKVISDRLGHSN